MLLWNGRIQNLSWKQTSSAICMWLYETVTFHVGFTPSSRVSFDVDTLCPANGTHSLTHMHRMSCLIEHNVYRFRAYVPFHSEIKSENTKLWSAGNANPRWSSPEQAMISQDWAHNVGYFLSQWCKHFNHLKAWSFLCYARDIPNTHIGLSGMNLFSVWQNQWQNPLLLSFQVKPTSSYTLPQKYVVKHDNVMYWQKNLQISETFSSVCVVFVFKQRMPEQWLLFIPLRSSKENKLRAVLNMHAVMHFAISKVT